MARHAIKATAEANLNGRAELSTSNRDSLVSARAGVKGPSCQRGASDRLISHESKEFNFTSHEEEESVDSIFPLQTFYS